MKKKIVLFAVLILAIAYFPAVAQSGCTCDAGCGSVTNVTVDFSKDGAGDLCFFIPCIGSYINSWNMAVVEINGQDFTNRWAAASSLPATIDGGYYIYYKGNYAWSHFEAKGACSAVTDPPSTPTPITDTPTPITSTATPTPVTVTSPPGVGDVSMSPSTVNANINEDLSFEIRVNSGTQKVAAYGIDITYSSSILSVIDVVEGAEGFVSAVNTNEPGLIKTTGFDTGGTGPGSNLHLLTVQMTAIGSGTSQIGISVDTLADDSTNVIGTPNGIGGSVVVGGTNPPSTATPTPVTVTETPITVTTPPGVGDVSMSPSTVNANINENLSFEIRVNSGSQKLAAYGIDITYSSSILSVVDVVEGAEGFVSAVNTNEPGLIKTTGFDTGGTGPGSNLHLLTIEMTAIGGGTSQIGITVDQLADDSTNVIGVPNGIGGSVVVGGTNPPGTATPTPVTVTETPTPVTVTETPTPVTVTDPPPTNPPGGCTCDNGCSSIINITTDFTKDGSGDLCYFIPCIGSYINSWNMAVLEVNGQDFTNKWTSASSLPATIDGGYYIYYKGNYAWSHFEAKGACSAVTNPPTETPVTETATPTPVTETATPITVTSPPGVGDVSMSPSTVNANISENLSFEIRVNSGTQKVAAYGIDITYSSSILSVVDVVEGADGFVSAVNTNEPGLIKTTGFDTAGTGPGSDLHLLTIEMTAIGSGTSQIGISVDQLADDSTNVIGVPNGIGGSVVVGGTNPPSTATPTPVTVTETPTPITVTSPPGVGDVSMSPNSLNAQLGDEVTFQIRVNSGTQKLAAYGINITYSSSVLSVVDVLEGADGFLSAVNTNEPGLIKTTGFDTGGVGPGSDLHLLDVIMSATGAGTSQIGITVDTLADDSTAVIGNPNGIGGSITVGGTAVPTATPVVTAVPTATPVGTAVPTETPVVTAVPTATPVVTAVPTETPVVTAVPTETPVVTAVPTATPVVTAVPTDPPVQKTAGSVWITPETQTVNNGASFTYQVHCHTGSQSLAAYGIDIYYNDAILRIAASGDVDEGADGFLAAVNINTSGKIVTSGFDTSGAGPGTDLHLLTVTMSAIGSGTSSLDIDVRNFVDGDTNVIGTPNGISGSVTVN